MDNQIAQLRQDKRRLYFWLLGTSAALLLTIGLTLGIIGVTQGPAYPKILEWLGGISINMGAGVIVVLLTLVAIRAFHMSEREEAEAVALMQSSGIQLLYRNWTRDKPSNEVFYAKFSEARVVNIIGITLSNTFVSAEWFAPLLAARLRDPEKTTHIAMLDPHGREITERGGRGWTHDVSTRANMSAAQMNEGFRLAQCSETDYHKFVRYFDYVPSANYIRFDNTAFIVLLMHRQGGLSPGLCLEAPGWLFEAYRKHFEAMWDSLEKVHQA